MLETNISLRLFNFRLCNNNASTSDKVTVVSHIKTHQWICLELFWICVDFTPDSDEMTFSLEKKILWIEDSYLVRNNGLTVKNVLMMDLFLTNIQLLSSQDVNWWTGVVWIIVMFLSVFGLSFWRHPFTAEDPLLRHWCDATFLQIWWRNKCIYIWDVLWVTFSAIFFLNKQFL